ncbi:hypothetical protein KFK09_008685 [Dendrobium nobile]|uniref:Uncharacterized protein n=1 Tax=Dendrobium nobile TaxID=94219 RepID=A0A8T3BRJ1_DENNO|nr:hypothetical protein KFK09_008685 [Dendrobium nobile]
MPRSVHQPLALVDLQAAGPYPLASTLKLNACKNKKIKKEGKWPTRCANNKKAPFGEKRRSIGVLGEGAWTVGSEY